MRLRHVMFVMTALSAIAHSGLRARAECPTLSLDDEFKRSAAVFVGRAIAQSVVPTPHDVQDRATATTFEVETLWKGEPGKTIRIRTCGWTVGDETMTCAESFKFIVGSRYVVFAEGGALETSTCNHTALMGRAAQTLSWLSHKPRKRDFRRGKAGRRRAVAREGQSPTAHSRLATNL